MSRKDRALTTAVAPATSALSTYISPREWADQLRCSLATVYRIADRARFRRLCVGHGRNGMVRYFREDIEAYEKTHTSAPDREVRIPENGVSDVRLRPA
jgi:hypothetical protein